MLDSTNNAAALAAQREAAREAARRAAIQEAQRQAAAQAAHQAALKNKPADAAPPADAPPPNRGMYETDEGFVGALKNRATDMMAGKTTPEAAKHEAAALEKALAKAETPEQLAKLADRAVTLSAQAGNTDDPAVQKQLPAIRELSTQITAANAAALKVQSLQADLASGDPAVVADTTAALLSRPAELTDAVKQLAVLKGTPLGKDMKQLAKDVAGGATPAALAAQLEADPDLGSYPEGFARNLLGLRAKNDPALNAALDKVGADLVRRANDGGADNPLSYDNVQAHPELARLMASTKTTDPEGYQKVVDGWGKAILDKSLDGVEGKQDTEAALDRFQEDMLGLAAMGVDPNDVGDLTARTLDANVDAIEKVAKKGESGGFLGIKKAFNWVKDKVSDLVNWVKDKVGDVAKKAAEFFYDHVIDPALDGSPLGPDTETFKGEKTGILGDLVTNRLEVGESAFVKLEANAAISGVTLGAGAQLEIKRVPKLDADGQPLPAVDGVPQTELQVKVLCKANAGVGLEAQFGKAMGKEKTVANNDQMFGASAGGGASAEAGVQGQAELTFSFDATDPEAIADMTGLFKEAAETGLKAAIPGVGPILAATNVPDAAEAAVRFGRHLETVRVEAGVYANASVEAGVQAGAVDEQKNAVYKAGEEPEDPEEPAAEDEKELTKRQQATKAAAGLALGEAGLDLGSVEASIGGELNAGIERNFKTGETTIYLSAEASAKAGVSGPMDLGASAAAAYNKTIAVTLGPDGKIKDLAISQEYSKTQFEGLGQTDIRGRVDSNVLAQLSEENSVTVTRKYQNLDDFKGKGPTAIAAQLLKDAHSEDNPNLVVDDITASETQQLDLGGDVAGIGLTLSLGRTQETDVEKAQWNEMKKSLAGSR